MGSIIWILVASVPVFLASLFYRLATLGAGGKLFAVLLCLALGIGEALFGYSLAFVGWEEVESTARGYQVVKTTMPVAGITALVVGAGIAMIGSLACLGAQRKTPPNTHTKDKTGA